MFAQMQFEAIARNAQIERSIVRKAMLEVYVEHRREVVSRRTAFRKAKAEARAHILEGLINQIRLGIRNYHVVYAD